MGSASTLCDISRAVLHQLSLSRRTRAKQPRNFRKVGRKGWFPATKLGESRGSGRCFGSKCFHTEGSKPSLPAGPGCAHASPHAFSPWDGGVLWEPG